MTKQNPKVNINSDIIRVVIEKFDLKYRLKYRKVWVLEHIR